MSVKLIDFGLARRIPLKESSERASNSASECKDVASEDDGLGPEGLMTTPVGTPHFVAPEVLSSLPYSKEVDIFACGVILYWLLSGRLPFEDINATRLAERIKRVEYDFAHNVWDDISSQAKDLIAGMLERSPFSRPSASDALSHPWLENCSPNSEPLQEIPVVPGDEIMVREWTADPAFDLGDDLCKGISQSLQLNEDKRYVADSLSSPVTPPNNSKHILQ